MYGAELYSYLQKKLEEQVRNPSFKKQEVGALESSLYDHSTWILQGRKRI
jgi:hypothetical protein